MEKIVLVTGATAGIGNAITRFLANNGFFVYAGARKEEDIEKLNKINNVTGIIIDLTNEKSIDNAFEILKDNNNFFAIINNAGTLDPKPIIESSMEDLRCVFEVNLFGAIRLIKTFIPLLRNSKGRIINISSLNGLIPAPHYGSYSMSKFAMEALSEQLRIELDRFGIFVSVLDIGLFATRMLSYWKKQIITIIEKNESEYLDLYNQELKQLESTEYLNLRKDPIMVAKVVKRALTDEIPLKRYLVCSDDEETRLYSMVLSKLIDMKQSRDMNFNRDNFLKIFEKQLSSN